MWCCFKLRILHEAAGKRTFSLIVDLDNNGNPIFFIQYRAVEEGEDILKHYGGINAIISLIQESKIEFCPYCGRNLNKQYKKNIDSILNRQYRMKRSE